MHKTLDQATINKGLKVLKTGNDGKLLTHLNSCVHCGLCAKSCIYYRAMPEARFIPATKVDLVASIYRRYATTTGKIFPALTGARKLDDKTAETMVDLLYGACTMCGRCTIIAPLVSTSAMWFARVVRCLPKWT